MAKLRNHGYIGTWKYEKKRRPGENTIAYYKFDGNLNDSAGNNNLSIGGGTPTYNTLSSGKKYIHFNTGDYLSSLTLPFNFDHYTVSGWCTWDTIPSSSDGYQKILLEFHGGSNYRPRFFNQTRNNRQVCGVCSWDGYGPSLVVGKWYNIIITYSNQTAKCWVNGVMIRSASTGQSASDALLTIGVGGGNFNSPGGINEVIFENITRPDDDAKLYYNQNCENYGLQPVN